MRNRSYIYYICSVVLIADVVGMVLYRKFLEKIPRNSTIMFENILIFVSMIAIFMVMLVIVLTGAIKICRKKQLIPLVCEDSSRGYYTRLTVFVILMYPIMKLIRG